MLFKNIYCTIGQLNKSEINANNELILRIYLYFVTGWYKKKRKKKEKHYTPDKQKINSKQTINCDHQEYLL